MNCRFLKVLATNKRADHIQLKNWHPIHSLQILNDIYPLM